MESRFIVQTFSPVRFDLDSTIHSSFFFSSSLPSSFLFPFLSSLFDFVDLYFSFSFVHSYKAIDIIIN